MDCVADKIEQGDSTYLVVFYDLAALEFTYMISRKKRSQILSEHGELLNFLDEYLIPLNTSESKELVLKFCGLNECFSGGDASSLIHVGLGYLNLYLYFLETNSDDKFLEDYSSLSYEISYSGKIFAKPCDRLNFEYEKKLNFLKSNL